MIDRRAAIIALAAVAASPSLPTKPFFALPEGITPEFLRQLAEESRQAIGRQRSRLANGVEHVQFTIERYGMNAEIFDRMASREEPFDALDAELWARDRALQAKHHYTPA